MPQSSAHNPVVTAVYAGTFDPLTNGHLDIIRRSAPLYHRLVVAIGPSPRPATFTVAERMAMLREVTADLPNVEADVFTGLLVDYAARVGAQVIIRGLRAVADFEHEFQQVMMNKSLNPAIETVLLMTSQRYSFLSSTRAKEVAALGGDVSDLVPPGVLARLREKFGQGRT